MLANKRRRLPGDINKSQRLWLGKSCILTLKRIIEKLPGYQYSRIKSRLITEKQTNKQTKMTMIMMKSTQN